MILKRARVSASAKISVLAKQEKEGEMAAYLAPFLLYADTPLEKSFLLHSFFKK